MTSPCWLIGRRTLEILLTIGLLPPCFLGAQPGPTRPPRRPTDAAQSPDFAQPVIVTRSDEVVSGKDLLRRGLRGNRAYSTAVVLSGPTRELGLAASTVGDRVKVRLNEANIKILEANGVLRFPKLHIQVEVVGPTPEGWYAVGIHAAVQDNLATVPLRGYDSFIGDSYSLSRIFAASGDLVRQEVRLTLDELLDTFIIDHLEMNSPAPSTNIVRPQ